MKKVFLLTFLSISFITLSFGQSQISVNIQHKLNQADFEVGVLAHNNLNQDFKVTRLQYYISEFELTHDGGQKLVISDMWALVDVFKRTAINLGTHDIEEVESIKFSIGVDPEHNHLDPSIYQTGHPLAPVFPSMHWGWAAGYRFVAMEGNCGNGLSQVFQLHALGDNNYFSTQVDISKVAENGNLVIDVHADYSKALENINIQSGVIVHGDNLQAQKMLENFRDYVFTGDNLTSAIDNVKQDNSIIIQPNPSPNGSVEIYFDDYRYSTLDINIMDLSGRSFHYATDIESGHQLDNTLLGKGIYILHFSRFGMPINNKKLIIE